MALKKLEFTPESGNVDTYGMEEGVTSGKKGEETSKIEELLQMYQHVQLLLSDVKTYTRVDSPLFNNYLWSFYQNMEL